MNPELKQAKQAIRAFIRMHWSDQKLAEVYAFNRDGKMCYSSGCRCLLGVTASERLHGNADCPYILGQQGRHHYYVAKRLPLAEAAEGAYLYLGFYGNQQARLSAILRAEMRRRARLRRAPERLGLDVATVEELVVR